MGRHKEWRKIVKRERRRKIRTRAAQEREEIINNEGYQKDQKMLYAFEMEMIEKTNAEENAKWLQAEQIAIHQWQMLQVQKSIQLQRQMERDLKLQIEWEIEKQKKKAEEERLKAIEEERRLKHENFIRNLEEFLSGDSSDPPKELLISRETKPRADPCPFFSKTSCCRFGDSCSRNHKYPGISNVLLATNFYDHFGWNNTTPTEYDTDIMLEFEDNETYKEFKEFFFDVLQEFEKFGKIIQFKVCKNFEKHLRGNVYVQYEELRCAVAAYRALHTRWYGGRQISLQFCLLNNWKNAICGLQFKKRCPKGRSCNYMHVFRNPDNLFVRYDTGERDGIRSPSRSWRWSESPEPETSRRSSKRDGDRGRSKHRDCDRRDYDDYDWDDREKRKHDSEKRKRYEDKKNAHKKEKRKRIADSDDDTKYDDDLKHRDKYKGNGRDAVKNSGNKRKIRKYCDDSENDDSDDDRQLDSDTSCSEDFKEYEREKRKSGDNKTVSDSNNHDNKEKRKHNFEKRKRHEEHRDMKERRKRIDDFDDDTKYDDDPKHRDKPKYKKKERSGKDKRYKINKCDCAGKKSGNKREKSKFSNESNDDLDDHRQFDSDTNSNEDFKDYDIEKQKKYHADTKTDSDFDNSDDTDDEEKS